jgi:hypothetical protein
MAAWIVRLAQPADLEAVMDLLSNQFQKHGFDLPLEQLWDAVFAILRSPEDGFERLVRSRWVKIFQKSPLEEDGV